MIQLHTLRRGSPHRELVEDVQTFLRGEDLYDSHVDGLFGPGTEAAVMAFQDAARLQPDGVVGNMTWGALMAAGLRILPSEAPDTDTQGPNWPPKPSHLMPLNGATRAERYGVIEFEHAPVSGNPEAIRITNDWREKNIVIATVPQLDRVPYAPGRAGVPGDERFACHRFVREPIQQLFAAWEDAGLMRLVLSWAGCWNPRFVRGSRRTLSNHAFGTAFDINAAWNGLGREPALVGRRGSVRELVPIAAEHGFYWGGWFLRPDGMHFEYVGDG